MKKMPFRVTAFFAVCALGMAVSGYAQSLTEKLSEEDRFYRNYGKDMYAKLKIEKDVVGLYDLFGVHITDGVKFYDFSDSGQVANNERDGIIDSMLVSRSSEWQRDDFYDNFSNLVILQDAIGGMKHSFLVGNQIATRFTPLTFNKTNFRGLRWDIWSTGLQFSLIATRTRPGFLSKNKIREGQALVEYPLSTESFPSDVYGGGFTGTDDYSTRSPYGDYDLLWAVHAENTIANKVDVGLSYINHHVSDVKEGEKWLTSELPPGWMPNEIHFEFYDYTAGDTLDAGVFVDDVQMYINGLQVKAAPGYEGVFRRVFAPNDEKLLLPKDLPIAKPQSGIAPVIVTFSTDSNAYVFVTPPAGKTNRGLPHRQVKSIKFQYKVAGNYMVFVSTDRQIPLGIQGQKHPQTGEVDYEQNSKTIAEIYEQGVAADASLLPLTAISTTYMGDWIAKVARPIPVTRETFERVTNTNNLNGPTGLYNNKAAYNYNVHEYEYRLNVSTQTFGVNFSGELGGTKFSGEAALNLDEHKLPGESGERVMKNKWVAAVKASRPIGKMFGISGEGYYISPEWRTNLSNLQASRYYAQTTYKGVGGKDYLAYPWPMGNHWYNIDDNEDNDPFVESDRRPYPSDLDADKEDKEDKRLFWGDGTLRWKKTKKLKLPYGQMIAYDDPDGVIASKNDRNKNGVRDYQEDFLLFSSDPPVFELGIDLNNNGVPDYEDDDILPDYGRSVGYVITSDGIKTLGIKGFNANFRITPSDNTAIDVGGFIESVNDHDLMDETSVADEGATVSDYEGKSIVAYVTASQEVLRRSQGIEYEIGAETRFIKDAIRNDVVVSEYQGNNNYNYFYQTDPLNYRQAFVGNGVASINYINIPNFEYGFRVKAGADKRFPINDKFYTVYTIRDLVTDSIDYDGRWDVYHDKLIGDANLVNRVGYTIKFPAEFEGWRSAFNFIKNLEITPQYKLAFSMKKVIAAPDSLLRDPRDMEAHIRMDKDGDNIINPKLDNIGDNLQKVADARFKWAEWSQNNNTYFLNVPILRLNYKIAENTQFQLGLQWKRDINLISPELNALQFTTLGQIVSRASYKGYTVTLFLGARQYNYDYDVNVYDPVLKTGSLYDTRGYLFFAQLYSGV